MNVLLTCAGRRNYLVQFFREALDASGRVFAADASADAPTLAEADAAFVLPNLSDPGYIDRLLAICEREQVGLLIPLNDLELPLLAQARTPFQAIGTCAVISSPAVVETCYDKWLTFVFLRAHGINTPRTYCSLVAARTAVARGEIAFPLVLKPRWGSGSSGIEYVMDDEELGLAYALAMKRHARFVPPMDRETPPEQTILIQEQLCGHEYGLDIVNDLDGRYVSTFAKRKFIMRAGETDRAAIVQHDGLARLGAQLGQALGHVGNLDCDVFLNGNTCTALEMNPRFGGGYPFAHLAGANLPAALIAWARGETPDPAWFTIAPHTIASKCDRLVIMDLDQRHGGGAHLNHQDTKSTKSTRREND